MNKQSAEEIGREYAGQLDHLAGAYESLSGKPLTADDLMFWESKEVEKVEMLSTFWWQIAKFNDPFYYDESFCEGNNE